MYKKILVPVDGSEQAEKAAKTAFELAKTFDAEVTLIHILLTTAQYAAFTVDTPITVSQDVLDQIESNANKLMDNLSTMAASFGLNINKHIDHGYPADVIINNAKKGQFDLIVIGSRGVGAVRGFLLGSVSAKVSHHSPCSVLIVH